MVELLTVVLVIVLLAGILIGVSGFARLRVMKNHAQSDVAFISLACDSFKADAGRYPTSSVYRMTDGSPGWFAAYNSSLLGTQLATGGYLSAAQPLRTYGGDSPFDVCHTVTNKSVATEIYPTTFTNLLNVLADPWESPYNYFRTYPVLPAGVQTNIQTPCAYQTYIGTNPGTAYTTNSCQPWIGGQVNVPSFDLWSYGPDLKSSSAAGCLGYNRDDIGNFQCR